MDDRATVTLYSTRTQTDAHTFRGAFKEKTIEKKKVAIDALLQGKHCWMITGKKRM